jgi:hypothetical protein
MIWPVEGDLFGIDQAVDGASDVRVGRVPGGDA